MVSVEIDCPKTDFTPFNLPDIFVNGVILSSPRFGAVNGFTIHRQPLSHLQQTLLKCRYDAAICRWANIQQHVTTTADKNKATFKKPKYMENVLQIPAGEPIGYIYITLWYVMNLIGSPTGDYL